MGQLGLALFRSRPRVSFHYELNICRPVRKFQRQPIIRFPMSMLHLRWGPGCAIETQFLGDCQRTRRWASYLSYTDVSQGVAMAMYSLFHIANCDQERRWARGLASPADELATYDDSQLSGRVEAMVGIYSRDDLEQLSVTEDDGTAEQSISSWCTLYQCVSSVAPCYRRLLQMCST